MYLWLELFLISTGITARLIIPASTCGSGVNLLVVIFIWLALLIHLIEEEKITTAIPALPRLLKLLLFLFSVLIIASFINAPYKFGAFQYLVAWLSDIVLFWLVYSLCARDPKYITTLLSVFLATALIVVLYGLYQHFWELRDLAAQIQQNPSLLDTIPGELKSATLARAQAGEPFATFIYQNSFGAFLALILPLFIVLAIIRQKTWWMGLVIVLVALFVLVKTGSKGAIVALVLGIGLSSGMYYFLRAPSVKRGMMLAGGGIIAIILLAFIIRSQMSDSLNVRLGYWDATVKIIRDNPLNGVGLNQFSNSYLYYKSAGAGEVLKAHNDYLQMASEMGIPALLVFLAIWFIILKSIFRPARQNCHAEFISASPETLNRVQGDSEKNSSILPYILGAGFAFLLSEIFQTPLIAMEIPFLSTIVIFILWVMAFWFLCGCLSKCHCEESGTTKQSKVDGIATPLRARNDNAGMGLLRIGLFAGLLAFLIHCLADFNLYVQGLSMSVWFIGAIFLSTAEPDTSLSFLRKQESRIMAALVALVVILLLFIFVRLVEYESVLNNNGKRITISLSDRPNDLLYAHQLNPYAVEPLLELSQWEHYFLDDKDTSCLKYIGKAISLNPLASMLYNQQGRLYLEHAEQERKAGHEKMAKIYEQRAKRAFQMVRELYPTYKDNDTKR